MLVPSQCSQIAFLNRFLQAMQMKDLLQVVAGRLPQPANATQRTVVSKSPDDVDWPAALAALWLDEPQRENLAQVGQIIRGNHQSVAIRLLF